MNPWSLDYWHSGEYQVVREKLDDESNAGFKTNPDRKELFRALALTAEKDVRVCIIGQDPYPQHRYATGVAFSIPAGIPEREFPPTLRVFLSEYCNDLGYQMPTSGNLEEWCQRGVLLWNAIPSCREGASLSHDWPGGEWSYLTREIITRLSTKGIVFAFLGSVAKRYIEHVDQDKNVVIQTSHPSPRGSRSGRTPFVGSRLFSSINARLIGHGLDPIDWRLDATPGTKDLPRTNMAGGAILQNITGADLGKPERRIKPNLAVSTFEL